MKRLGFIVLILLLFISYSKKDEDTSSKGYYLKVTVDGKKYIFTC